MYEGWCFTKRSEWLAVGDGNLDERGDFIFGTCTTIVVADSDSYHTGIFDIVLVRIYEILNNLIFYILIYKLDF